MALQGTLKDFGIAEILQLIGQQAKSGVLHVRNKEAEIHIQMSQGSLVSAEHSGRRQRERLGTLLVRAGLLSREGLEEALETQKRTLRRLGDILVEMGSVTKQDLREMTALQTTDTVYQLFQWKDGTYEFEPGEVEYDRETVSPLRAESVLMEGFRQVDEWPMVRRKISSPAMTFARLRPRPESDGGQDGEEEGLGPTERRVFALAEPDRPVERIVDLSRLGEFETCKALFTLVNMRYLRPIPPPRLSPPAGVSAYARDWQARLRSGAASLAATVAIAAVLAGLVWVASERGARAEGSTSRADGTRRLLARHQLAHLSAALEVYRLERGEYPAALSGLVEAGLVGRSEVAYPWSEPYHYRRTETGFLLLPPLR